MTDDQSTPIPGAGHNYLGLGNETMDPANGSISFRLGADVPKGRGLSMPFAFAYDSNGAFHVVSTGYGGTLWSSNNGFGWAPAGGWAFTLPMLSWSYQTVTQGNWSCDYVSDFVFQDPTGGRHFLGMAALIDTWSQCSNVGGIITGLTGGDDVYYAVASNSDASIVLATDRTTGTAYSFSVIPAQLYTVASFVEDRNGNKITLSSSYGNPPITVNDTLGRQLTISTGNPQAVQVPGLANPYDVSWIVGGSSYPSVGQTADPHNVYDTYCLASPIASFGYGSSIQAQVANTISLPNGEKYQFSYDPTYGLLSQIIYPDGAWIKYTWGMNHRAEQIWLPDSQNIPGQCLYTYDFPAVSERQVSFDGVNLALDQTFTYNTNWVNSVGYKSTTVTSTDYTQSPHVVTITQYTYNPVSTTTGLNDGPYVANAVPVESSVSYEDGSNTVYRVVNKTWSDQYMMTCESVTQGGVTSRTEYNPGAAWPWSTKKEWDWNQAPACGNPATNSPTRETDFIVQAFSVQVYPLSWNLWQYPVDNPLFGQPTKITVNYNGAQAAQTTFGYDSGGVTSGGATVGRDPNYNSSGSITARGNATSKSEWLNTTGGSLTWNFTYDDTGQQTSMSDIASHQTQYIYSDSFAGCGSPNGSTDAYLTKIQDAKGFTQLFTYRYCDGQLSSATDRNTQTTSYAYSDSLNRLTSISYPDGGQTTYGYSNACGTPYTTNVVLQGSSNYTETAAMDGLCHVTRTTVTSDPQGYDYVDSTYDGFGRVLTVSNPYRTGDSTQGVTGNSYDPVGRVFKVTYPDQSVTQTSYSGNSSTVVDPAGMTRTLVSDGLGRLTSVTENPGGLNYSTAYTYDGLDNLTSVTQGYQLPCNGGAASRSFVYDSISRMTSACNPESGTTSYTYPTSSSACSGDASSPCTIDLCIKNAIK